MIINKINDIYIAMCSVIDNYILVLLFAVNLWHLIAVLFCFVKKCNKYVIIRIWIVLCINWSYIFNNTCTHLLLNVRRITVCFGDWLSRQFYCTEDYKGAWMRVSRIAN